MERLLEYSQNHPLLVSLAVAMAIAVVVFEARSRAQNYSAIAPQEAIRLMNQGAAVIDLRDREAWANGHVSGARHLTTEQLANAAETLKKHREKPVVIYCEGGSAATRLTKQLHASGFTKVFSLRGGLAAWRAEGLPLQRG